MVREIEEFLSAIPGVIDTAVLEKHDIPAVIEAEEANEDNQLVKLVNLGVRQVVGREHIVVFVKDERFRKPPCPTIYMVEEAEKPKGNIQNSTDYIEVDGNYYYIVGEEVIDKNKQFDEKHVFFEESFVLFPKRRENRQQVPAYFLIPPVSFPELEEKKESLGITNIMSVSPSTKCDDYIRNRYDLPKRREFATILIGFDTNFQ